MTNSRTVRRPDGSLEMEGRPVWLWREDRENPDGQFLPIQKGAWKRTSVQIRKGRNRKDVSRERMAAIPVDMDPRRQRSKMIFSQQHLAALIRLPAHSLSDTTVFANRSCWRRSGAHALHFDDRTGEKRAA